MSLTIIEILSCILLLLIIYKISFLIEKLSEIFEMFRKREMENNKILTNVEKILEGKE